MTEDTAKKAGMSRGWRIVLILSLGLNLAVLGMAAGAAFKHGRPHPDTRFGDPMVRALDAETRRKIGGEIRASRGDKKAFRAGLDAVHQDVLSALRATPFDAAALQDALAQKSAFLQQSRGVGEAALVAHLAGLSDAERADFADRLEDKLSERKRSRH